MVSDVDDKGAKVRLLRNKRGLSQFKLGLLMSPPVHPRTVARWESGTNFPGGRRIVELARLLGVSAEDLTDSR